MTVDSAARPLTEAQAGMWFAQRLDTGNPIFNTAQRTDIEGALDVAAFEWAVDTAMAECDGLALRVVEIDGVPHGVIDPAHRPRLRRRQDASTIMLLPPPPPPLLPRLRLRRLPPLQARRPAPARPPHTHNAGGNENGADGCCCCCRTH